MPTFTDGVLSDGGKGAVGAAPVFAVTGPVVQSVAVDTMAEDCYPPYQYDGSVKLGESHYPVGILLDTGSTSFLWVRPKHVEVGNNSFVLLFLW